MSTGSDEGDINAASTGSLLVSEGAESDRMCDIVRAGGGDGDAQAEADKDTRAGMRD